ncbi:hypothetical protein Scep_022143 [Stephania cephalantha]|uniref:Uncharacterized protein n=1 Tax=Stephania cephalantha TaxID=152367 RepID=A0AAP0I2F2_9MAGN
MPRDVCGTTKGFSIYCPRMFVEFSTEGFACPIEFISVSLKDMSWSCLLLYFCEEGHASVTVGMNLLLI